MTTEDKLKYIQGFMKLTSEATTYRDALSHCNFTRGVLAAYLADRTIKLVDYHAFTYDLDIVMDVKRKLPTKGDVV